MYRVCLFVYVFRIVLRLPPTCVAFFLCCGGNGGIAGTIVGDRVGMGAGAGMLTGVGVVVGVGMGTGMEKEMAMEKGRMLMCLGMGV